MEACYAVDFGTSNSLLAVCYENGDQHLVKLDPKNQEDPYTLKSVFYTLDQKNWIYGSSAIEKYTEFAGEGRLFRSIKKFLPEQSFKGTRIGNNFYSLEKLISMFLREMKNRADKELDLCVDKIMLGRPAVFSLVESEHQLAIDRLEKAARLAGFKEISFCPEPVAAANQFKNELDSRKLVLVADFGGGTSDFTILYLDRDGFKAKDVLAIDGINVAGDRYDGALMREFIAPHFGADISYQLPLSKNILTLPKALKKKLNSPADMSFLAQSDVKDFFLKTQRFSFDDDQAQKLDQLFTLIDERLGYSVFKTIEKTKRELSHEDKSSFSYQEHGIEILEVIGHKEFVAGSSKETVEIMRVLDKAFSDAKLKYEDIDLICLTGGSAKIPQIKAELEKRFGDEIINEHDNFQSVIKGLTQSAFEEFYGV